MVFLGTKDYRDDTAVYPTVERSANENYRDLLALTDEPQAVVDFIAAHPPRRPKVWG